MKISLYSLTMAALLLGSMLPAEAQQVVAATVTQPDAGSLKSPDKVRKQLAAAIAKALPEPTPKQISAFLKKPENLRTLIMYHIACSEAGAQEGYKNYNNSLKSQVQNKQQEIQRLENEVKNKKGAEKKRAEFQLSNARNDLKTLNEEAKYPADLSKCGKVLSAIMSDVEWMEQIVFSGEMHNFTRVVQIIDAIAKSDPNALKKGVERDTTTAVALEYARYGIRLTAAVERAQYFLKYWRQGRLNVVFDDLSMYHRRVACGWKPNHNSGTIKAFEWALDNVHVPDWQYPGSCWRCGYILDNVFGDSIHGAWYFAPWAGVKTDNHMWLTKNVGGVCGGLSHFGAASACANGVPALTAGEPGHCAYIVRVNGRWTPAYSLSWERGLHWTPWDNNWTYSALHLTDDLFDAKNEDRTRISNSCRVLAQVYSETDQPQKALTCYDHAAKAAPLNYPMWREYAAFLANKMPKNADAWKELNRLLCKGVASKYPEQAAELLRNQVYGRMAASGMSADALADACALFWKYADKMGPDRWYIDRMNNDQLNTCKKAGGDAEQIAISLYTKVLKAAAAHDAYSGTLMAWGNSISGGLSEAGRKQLTDSMIAVLGTGSADTAAQRAKLLGGLMLSAERARDTETFYAISKMIDPKEIHGPASIPDFRTFPGKLVSEGGLPFASSTSEWDHPHTHSGLLTRQGAQMHTSRENNPWIAVKLPKHAFITGVVFAGTNQWSLIHRFRPIKVQVSDTGRDDDWHDVGQPIQNTGNYINTFDLQNERPKALYVRVLRPGGPEVFHANGIYVFGEPAA